MKNILITIVLILVLGTSCKKSFIETLPESSITEDQIFKTDADYQSAVNGCYAQLRDIYSGFWILSDLPGDDVTQYALRTTGNVHIDNFVGDVSDANVLTAWTTNYQLIASTNVVLSKIETADPTVVTNKAQYIGEAKFLRALAYFNLVRLFGDVPKVLTPISIAESKKTPRTSAATIYNEVIIPDLLDADAKLPATYTAANVGRATKGAAKSILGKVYLTVKDFVKAEAKLTEVTAMGYVLLPNFNDLFNYTGDNQHHKEYIFDVEYLDGNIGLGSPFTRAMTVETQDVGTTFTNAVRTLYNITGTQGAEAGGTPDLAFMKLFDPDDKRLYRTATDYIITAAGTKVSIPAGSSVPVITQKFMAPISTDNRVNWKVTRYADVLLMLAEALNENGKTPTALTYLNQVRTRAGVPTYSDLNQTDTREKIYLERRFELCMEGDRWFDLVRTGRALSTMASRGMKPNQTIFPIPETEIEVVNDPSVLGQNPGY